MTDRETNLMDLVTEATRLVVRIGVAIHETTVRAEDEAVDAAKDFAVSLISLLEEESK